MTSAVESSDDYVLRILDKDHSREDFVYAAALMRQLGLQLSPTFVSFTPWTTRAAYCDLLALIAELDPVSYTHLDVYKRQGLTRCTGCTP